LWDADPGEPWVPLYNEACIPVNRYPVHETINGLCTAYYYVYSDAEPESAGYPVFFSDQNNKPFRRRSRDEGYIDLQVAGGKPPGWRSGTLRSDGAIPAGTNLWFGISTDMFWYATFDYGSTLYTGDYNFDDLLPDTYVHYTWSDYFNDFRLSMYFEYTSAQNYVRTLYQGVTLNDTQKHTGDFKRSLVMNTEGISFLDHASDYYRKHTAGVQSIDMVNRLRGFFRTVTENIQLIDLATYCRDFSRVIGNVVRPCTGETRKLDVKRNVSTEAGVLDSTARQRGFIRTLFTAVNVQDYAGKFLTCLRVIRHGAAAFDRAGYWGDYLRGLYVEAGSRAETNHRGAYYRLQQDHVSTQALSLRHLVIFIRLVTAGLIRDYLIGRFFKAREELVLKSGICREIILEIILESNIH
jgi:hypothetical protein